MTSKAVRPYNYEFPWTVSFYLGRYGNSTRNNAFFRTKESADSFFDDLTSAHKRWAERANDRVEFLEIVDHLGARFHVRVEDLTQALISGIEHQDRLDEMSMQRTIAWRERHADHGLPMPEDMLRIEDKRKDD